MYDYIHIGNATHISDPKERRRYRLLEIFPGLLAWSTLVAVIILSYYTPVAMAIFIIVFDIYWLTKTIYLSLHMRSTFGKMQANMKRDWLGELKNKKARNSDFGETTWEDIYHLVILPMAHEPLEVIRQSFEGLAESNYPKSKLIVVLATEERAGEKGERNAEIIKSEFGQLFYKFLVTVHPANLPGETPGKGSNETWAGKEAKKLIIDELGIPYENIITSVFDIDTVVPKDFFLALTWYYLDAEQPLRSSFQPVPLFTNNIWEAPAFARVFAFSTTFWQMIQQARQEQLVTFSSQSIGFKPLVEIGFWQTNMVSEDSRVFWQCLLRYDGNWRTVAMHFPVYMDANVASTFWQTAKNQYKQIRRWFYGIENNPYFMYGFSKNSKIPRSKKWYFTFNMIEKAHSGATNALIIFFLGWLPTLIGRNHFAQTLLSYNLPRITRTIMGLAMIGLITSAAISIILLPPRPQNYGRHKWPWMALQWILFPINFIFYGAVPALDAQTRLMLGKYMGFWNTPKVRKEIARTKVIENANIYNKNLNP